MSKLFRRTLCGAAASLAFVGLSSAHAVSLTVTVSNTQTTSQDGNGLSLTPLWVGFFESPATFDAFDAGETASDGVEVIAEVGGPPTQIDAELNAAQPGAASAFITSPGGVAPTIDPGETTSFVIDVDPASGAYFQFLSMVVPTNDTFVGNDDPALLFDDEGNFLGEQTFDLTLATTYDAGTEANDLNDGAAFLANVNGTLGTETNDAIASLADPEFTDITDFSLLQDALLADGQTTLDPVLAQLFFDGEVQSLGSVTVSLTPDTAPIPVPGAALLFGGVMAVAAGAKRRKLLA